MKRKFTLLALVLVVVVLATSVLFACNKETNDGKYYKYEDGVKDENSWIEIKGNKWIDDAGDGGTFEEKGDGVIELYDEAGEWFCSGELKDGVLVLDLLFFAIEYRKDGATGSTTPKTHTVTLNTEGGKLTGEATHTLTYDSEYTLPVPTKKG